MYYIELNRMGLSRRGAGAQECNCNAPVVGSIPIRENQKIIIYIFFSWLWHPGKRTALSSARKNLEEIAERSILSLGSLCLQCLVRDSTKQ